MRAEIGRLDPLNEVAGTAVLGRISDALLKNGYKVDVFGIDTDLIALEGKQKYTLKGAADSADGFPRIYPSGAIHDDLMNDMRKLNKASDEYNNIFSDAMSATMVSLNFFSSFLAIGNVQLTVPQYGTPNRLNLWKMKSITLHT